MDKQAFSLGAHLFFAGAHLPDIRGKRLHLGVSGSIAAYKALELLRLWQKVGLSVSATLTAGAQRFVTPLSFEAMGAGPLYGDMFTPGAPFEHLEPGHIAHAFMIAPATANVLARLAQGLADDMLTCQALAFGGSLVLAPAMNPAMWQNPATKANVDILRQRGHVFVGPDSGLAACNDEGQGRLASLPNLFLAGLKAVCPQDFAGKKIMVTLGPTREAWDQVRFWTNASTGIMGASLAVAAWLRGAEVYAVCGPVDLAMPVDPLFQRLNVRSAAEMFATAAHVWPSCDAGIFTAAVADFSPQPLGQGKFKKEGATNGFDLHFNPNADILRSLAAERRPHQKVVGFAAEDANTPEALAEAVRKKLHAKKADMVVGNSISHVFGNAQNTVFVADAQGREQDWPEQPKTGVAWNILNWLKTLD